MASRSLAGGSRRARLRLPLLFSRASCRARRLGAIMADEVSAIDGKTDPARETEKNHALPMQRRILLAFAVEVGLDAFLPNQPVSYTHLVAGRAICRRREPRKRSRAYTAASSRLM